MKQLKTFAFLVAAVAAVSCADRLEDVKLSGDRPITLNPQTLAVSTRAAIDGTVFPDDRTIVLSAYLNAVTGTSANLFSGVTFEKDGSVWSADKYWPLEGTLDMFAYSADGLTLTDVTYSTKVSDGVTVTVPDNSSTQCDIMHAGASAQEYSSSGTALALRHSQAMLVWTAGATVAYDATNNRGVTITKITLKNAKYSGTLAMTATAVSDSYCTWSGLGSQKDKDLPGLTSYNVPATPMDITADGNHMGIGGVGIMVPEQAQTAFVIAYTIHGGKDAGGNAYDYDKTITYPCTGDWVEGNKYNYVMTFNVVNNAIEVAASVADWTVEPKAISLPEPVAATYSVVSATSVSLPKGTMSAGCEVMVDWGDGTCEAYANSSESERIFSHTYSSAYTGDVSLVVRAGNLGFVAKAVEYAKFTVTDDSKVTVSKQLLLPGVFTVCASPLKKVKFSVGNLMANVNADGTAVTEWKLADNQYSYLGITAAQNQRKGGWVDAFSWMPVGKYTDGVKQYGILASNSSYDFNLYGKTDVCCDWGSNIGSGMTILSSSEWEYLIDNAFFSTGVTVAGVVGRILKPDGFSGTVQTYYTAETWKAAEEIGLVFLPYAGNWYEMKYNCNNTTGSYQTKSPGGAYANYLLEIRTDGSPSVNSRSRVYGGSVRLVSVQE